MKKKEQKRQQKNLTKLPSVLLTLSAAPITWDFNFSDFNLTYHFCLACPANTNPGLFLKQEICLCLASSCFRPSTFTFISASSHLGLVVYAVGHIVAPPRRLLFSIFIRGHQCHCALPKSNAVVCAGSSGSHCLLSSSTNYYGTRN